MAERVALFGGSFDPVHIGHLFVAEEVRIRLGYDRVIFVPAAHPPHKNGPPAGSATDRLAMLGLAVEHECFSIGRWEIDRGGVSYTIDTVRQVIADGLASGKPGLIIGDDLVSGFSSWREPEEVINLANIIVVRRQDTPLPELLRDAHTVDNSPLPVSSSQIRKRVQSGHAFRYLVPEPVYRYIVDHRLYQDS
ncbi:MAG: nicotinate (nicotinamide) nucleotide adenylyltransferase [Spirochaetaceae bacterium]|nr:MAG: nicotinate (nicotinamide) nucleotide adenylyltransferase [Spirochaetaceae bacterium]